MKRWGLLLLRVTTGWLLVLWGIDKFQNVAHGQAVAETFYFGIGTQAVVQQIVGGIQILLGALVILGLWRRRAYPVMLAILALHGHRGLEVDHRPVGMVPRRLERALLPVGDHRGGRAPAVGDDRRGRDGAGCNDDIMMR